jgi:hypothetical protein
MLAAQLFSMFGTLLGLTGILLYIVVWDLRKKWL